MFTVLRRSDEEEESQGDARIKINYWRLLIVVAALLGWALVLESFGFLPATFLLMIILYRVAGFGRWYQAVTWGFVTVLIAYIIFTYLGVRFPVGILRPLGFS